MSKSRSRQQARKVIFRPNNPQIFHTMDAALVAFPETKKEDWLVADSTGEFNRFEFLLRAQARDEIFNLHFHPRFILLEQTALPKNILRPKRTQSQIKYDADFSYIFKGLFVVEDFKAAYGDTAKNRAKNRVGDPILQPGARDKHKLLTAQLISKYGALAHFKLVTQPNAALSEE